jgi:hypothetical protein
MRKFYNSILLLWVCLFLIHPADLSAKNPKNYFFFENKQFLANYTIESVVIHSTSIYTYSYSSPGKAFLKSLLLPGWGELSAGSTKRGASFLLAEGILWGSFAALQVYSSWKQKDLENFAVERAQVNSIGKSKSFYSDVSNFSNIYEYNEEKRRFRQYDEVYPVDEDHFWQWKKERDQEKFDEMRSSTEVAKRNATLVIGGILVNHIISSVDAIWVTHQANKKISSSIQLGPFVDRFGEIGFTLSLSKKF